MSIPSNVAKGKIVIENLPDLKCFTDFADFVKELPSILGVEVPGDISNVVISNSEPSSSQTQDLWMRISNSGQFIGFYVFGNNKWNIIYPLNTTINTGVYWITSDDGSVPAGFQKITVDSTDVPSAAIAPIMAQYVADGSIDVYFAVTYVGF